MIDSTLNDMKKLLLLSFIFNLFWLSSLAQEKTPDSKDEEFITVVGAVIDEWGNPLPGALVKSKNGVETHTESDGTFTIHLSPKDKKLTAHYSGLMSKKKGIKKQPVIFELKSKKAGYVPLFALPLYLNN